MQYLKFHYNDKGMGFLAAYNSGEIVMSGEAKTGSTKSGKLMNNIPQGVWYGKRIPEDTKEPTMTTTSGNGWKWRMYDQMGNSTNFFVHPDGNKRVIRGCIGLQNDYMYFKKYLSILQTKQEIIPVYVNVDPIKEGE